MFLAGPALCSTAYCDALLHLCSNWHAGKVSTRVLFLVNCYNRTTTGCWYNLFLYIITA